MSDETRATPTWRLAQRTTLLTSKTVLSITRTEIRFIGALGGCYLICALYDKTIGLQCALVIPTDPGIHDRTGSRSTWAVGLPIPLSPA